MSKGALGLLAAYWPEDTPRYAHIPLKTVGEATLYAAADAAADKTAVASGAGTLSYADFRDKVKRFGEALRARVDRGGRVAIAAANGIEMMIGAFGAFEADALAFLHDGPPSKEMLDAFSPALVIGQAPAGISAPVASFDEIMASEGKPKSGRPDFRTPILAQPMPGGKGEALHSHRTLAAIGISLGRFYLLAEDIHVVLLEPPDNWCTLSIMLGAIQRGATIWTAWESNPAKLPDRVDYVVCSWERASRLFDSANAEGLTRKIGAGLIAGIEGPFSTSRRIRLGRKLRTDILTTYGRNDLGPVIASHPAWFLNDAAGIPLPNVDLRPLNPANGEPLNIGWEVVDSAEIGVKSALSPAGGTMIQGWLRTGLMAQVDTTGFYFLLPEKNLRAV